MGKEGNMNRKREFRSDKIALGGEISKEKNRKTFYIGTASEVGKEVLDGDTKEGRATECQADVRQDSKKGGIARKEIAAHALRELEEGLMFARREEGYADRNEYS